jgi:hypothetical protein
MEENKDNIDRLFRERLTNFEQKPDDAVWEKISYRIGPVRQRGLIYLLIRIAAGMTLLFSLGLGYYLINSHVDQNLPSTLTFRPADKAAKDTVIRQKARKSHPNQPERKKTEKSDRLQPVRKIYKGPGMNSLESQEEGTDPHSQGQGTNRQESLAIPHREPQVLTALYGRELYVLPGLLPLDLQYRNPAGGSEPVPEPGLLLSDLQDFPPENNETRDQHEWVLGGEVAPLYSYRRTVPSNYMSSSMVDALNKSESGLLAYAGGIRIAYTAGKRFSVQSGVYYSRYGQEKGSLEAYTTDFNSQLTDRSTATYLSIPNSTGTIEAITKDKSEFTKVFSNSKGVAADVNFNTGFPGINTSNIVPVTESDLSATQYFDYLELPLTVKYKIINRKFGFSVLGGMVTNFLVNNGVNLHQNGKTQAIAKTSDINKVNYLGSVGLGFEYPVIKNVAFSLEPRFRYYINPIDQSSSVHPYSFGIFAGISYGF